MNLRVGVNLSKQMNKLVKHKRVPYYTYNYTDEGNGVTTMISKSECHYEDKKMLPGKSEYYMYAAAGILGIGAALGFAISKNGHKKKHMFW